MSWAGGARPGLAQGSPAGMAGLQLPLSVDHRPLAHCCSPPTSLAELLGHKGELSAHLWAIPRLHRLEEERKLCDTSEKPGEERVLLVTHREQARRGAKRCGPGGECWAVPWEPLCGWGRGGLGRGGAEGEAQVPAGSGSAALLSFCPGVSGRWVTPRHITVPNAGCLWELLDLFHYGLFGVSHRYSDGKAPLPGKRFSFPGH